MRVYLCTHEGNWMLESIEKEIEIPAYELSDGLVIPLPDYISRSGLNRFRANVTRNTQFTAMRVADAAFR